jgi:sec-independent protein translocase protein TatC
MSTEERKGFLSSVFQKKNRSIEAEMSFFDHLEELRWRFLRSLIAVVVLALVAFNYKEIIFDMILLGPKNPDFWTYKALCFLSAKFNLDKDLCVEKINFTLQNLEMAGQFLKHLSISIITGFILAKVYQRNHLLCDHIVCDGRVIRVFCCNTIIGCFLGKLYSK